MSTPSFSSFPAFSTFPDLDPGPSTRSAATFADKDEDKEKEKKHHKKSRRDQDRDSDTDRKKRKHKHRHDKHRRDDARSDSDDDDGARREPKRDRHRHRRRSRSPSSRQRSYGGSDDERRKAEEDRRRHAHADSEISLASIKEGLLYITDRRGDPLNVRYGGLHAGDVPKYRLVDGGRRVLGLPHGLSVVYRGRGGVEIALSGRRKMPELTDPSVRRMLAAGPTRRLLASAEDRFKYQEQDGFLRITTHRRHHLDEQSYREIEPSKPLDPDIDSSASSASDASSSDTDTDTDAPALTSLQLTLKSLEERLAAHPDSIPTWLALLSHTLTTVPAHSKNAARARAEIALSVLARALAAHPANARSTTLWLRYMRAGEEVWPEGKVREEWEDAVRVDDVEIWMAWLDWRVRTSRAILTDLVEDVGRVVYALGKKEDEVGQLRVLWRAAVALRDAGYVERANALFQAQAELLYRLPTTLSTKPFEDQLNGLEEFWDSEVPRLGEPGALGWSTWEASNRPSHPSPPSPPHAPSPDPRIADPYARWAASESLADRIRALPLRSTDEDPSDADADPYAVVLFSDIRPLLLPLRTPRAKDVFRLVWLAFLGLHVPGFLRALSPRPEESTDDRWAYTHLAAPSYLGAIFPAPDAGARRVTADAHAGVLVGREREFGSGFGPVRCWGYGVVEPLESFGQGRWTMWGSEDVQGVDAALAREVFRQCRLPGQDAEWDVLYLAFEAAVSLKGALKASKALLAGARDSLPHWAAHARLETLRGRPSDARKVYQTILAAPPASPRPGEAAMWWDWAQTEWLARADDAALQVIVRASGGTGSGGIAVLRAKRHFENLLATELLGAHWRERAPWIKLAALLELLTASPQSAMGVFDHYLNLVELGSPAHESLAVASLALLYNHSVVLKNPTPPALLRERAERAIEEYPANTVILGVFLEAEKGQGIWGRVRAMLGETKADGTGKEKGVARRVAEVWAAGWEKGRWEAEVERTRSGLAAAAEDERTRGSAVLWKVFVAFEARAGQTERAKKVLFRAVGECPLVKELYLLAFGPLRGAFSARELNQWADTMAERGVRMRVGLDEVVGEWREGEGAQGSRRGVGGNGEAGDEEGVDEIEYNARELRRLMPY
ncbi:DUF1740-domain-containing protein [Trametes coccinea BRFM310]|uniref:DUF1740-domain-containing protein n=1 Tax=Trametes coccinea (strain BRFM310) TaxID=1353009 RepID=A0A1Y2IEH7_TRAC3|nr:DUF1740-domain-containing protein [Trametes coccinea BRFM310]